jgi:hypothetical protein
LKQISITPQVKEQFLSRKKVLLVTVGGLVMVSAIAVGVWLLGLALRSDSIIDQVGIWPTATPFTETQISGNSEAVLAAQLAAAGLTPGPYLNATGIETHLGSARGWRRKRRSAGKIRCRPGTSKQCNG